MLSHAHAAEGRLRLARDEVGADAEDIYLVACTGATDAIGHHDVVTVVIIQAPGSDDSQYQNTPRGGVYDIIW